MLTNFRALVHMSSILVPVFVEATSRTLTVAMISLITIAYVAGELMRVKGHSVPLLSEFTLRMSRPGERRHFITQPVYLALGVIVVLIFFPRLVAYAAIAIVAVGDPIAAYVGKRIGRRHIRGKTLEGFVAGTLAGFAPTLLLVPPIVGIVGATAGMLLELSGIIDDNLSIPIGSGAVMFLTTTILMSVKI